MNEQQAIDEIVKETCSGCMGSDASEEWRCNICGYKKAIDALQEKKNNQWIPVSDKLPTKTERVLVTLKNEYVCECFWINGTFKQIDGCKMREFFIENPVIAWRPLPEPYKE